LNIAFLALINFQVNICADMTNEYLMNSSFYLIASLHTNFYNFRVIYLIYCKMCL